MGLTPLQTTCQLYCGHQFVFVEETEVQGRNHQPATFYWIETEVQGNNYQPATFYWIKNTNY